MSTLDEQLNDHPVEPRKGLSRRNVLVTSAWAVPTITVASAAPAFAAASDPAPVMTVTWVTDSFRGAANSNTPSNTQNYFYTGINIAAAALGGSTNSTLSQIIVAVASPGPGNGISVRRHGAAVTRGATSWGANNSDFTGWTVGGGTLPAANGESPQTDSWSFTRTQAGITSAQLRIMWGNIDFAGGNADVPIVYTVTAKYNNGVTELTHPSTYTVTINTQAGTPYVGGAVT